MLNTNGEMLGSQPHCGSESLLCVRNLSLSIEGKRLLSDVSLEIRPGQVVGIAGESGSGKSLTALSIMGLLPDSAALSGSITYRGVELVGAPESTRAAVRGAEIAMVFQETVSALNPVMRIGRSLVGAIRANQTTTKQAARVIAAEALRDVSIRDVERVLDSFPHELSGGMCQRVVIAMALACGSDVLIADEPTTALDVSVQRGILELIQRLVRERSMACIFISHDLGVLHELADDVLVMYGGEVVEQGPASDVIGDPLHPYSHDLLSYLTPLMGDVAHVQSVEPIPSKRSTMDAAGCNYAHTCPWEHAECGQDPDLVAVAPSRSVRCWLYNQPARSADATEKDQLAPAGGAT